MLFRHGRGHFQESQKVAVIATKPVDWSSFRYYSPYKNVYLKIYRAVAFDDPDPKTQDSPFEARYKRMLSRVDIENPLVVSSLFRLLISFDECNLTAFRLSCGQKQQLMRFVQAIIDDGGEGIIMRKLDSLYEQGRSKSVIKLKVI